MQLLRPQVAIDTFFARLSAASQRALLLDYDGTLAPLVADRDRALPYPGVREILGILIGVARTRVVIISGRPLRDLEALLGLDPLPELWGSHGWERRLPDGTYGLPSFDHFAEAGLMSAVHVATTYGVGHSLERKSAGLVLHWRGLAPRTVSALEQYIVQLWTPIAIKYQLALQPFDGGLELRVPGRDKGSAVRTLLDELNPASCIAYLGDDLTDEAAFQALGHSGLRVLVRPELRETAADLWLRPPVELLPFLRRWA